MQLTLCLSCGLTRGASTPPAEQTLCRFAGTVDESLLDSLQPIILNNARSGRLERCLARGYYTCVGDYVRGVARYYELWQPTVEALVVKRQDAAWVSLLDQLQRAAWRQLNPASFFLLDGLDATAYAVAVDAALEVLRGRYPFDCDFPAWARAIVRVLCRRTLTVHSQNTDALYHCHDDDLDLDFVECDESVNELLFDLEWATNRLATGNRREFARLHYFEGKDYVQIASETGKSLGALYKLNSDTLANYRQLLNQ